MKKIFLLFCAAAAVFGLATAVNATTSNPVLDDYVAVSDALAKDDLAAAKTAASKLSEAASAEKLTTLAEQAAGIASSDSLEAAREHFKVASREAEKLAAGLDGYHVFTCPMAKADWVQKTEKIQNPYMGPRMSACGSLKAGKPGAMKQTKRSGPCCG